MKKLAIVILVIVGLVGAGYVWTRQPDALNLQVLVPQNQYWNQPNVTVSGVSFGADHTTVTVKVGDQVVDSREFTAQEWSFVLAVPVREGDLTITAVAQQLGWFIYPGEQAQQEVVFRVDQTPPVISHLLAAATPQGLLVNGFVQDSYSGISGVSIAGYAATVDAWGNFSGTIPWETALLVNALEVRVTDKALNTTAVPVGMQYPEEYTIIYDGNGVAVEASSSLGLECPAFDVYFKNYRCQYVSRRMLAESWMVRRFDPYPPVIAFTIALGAVVIVISVVAWRKRRRQSPQQAMSAVSLVPAMAGPSPAVAVVSGPRRENQIPLWQLLSRAVSAMPASDLRDTLRTFLRVNQSLPGGDAALIEAANASGNPALVTLIEEVNRGR